MNNIAIAFIFTAIAGLSTGVGSFFALFAKKESTRFLSISLGFSAGVMIYVSFIEIIPKAQNILTPALGARAGALATAGAFFGGMLLIALIDKLIPKSANPHEWSAKDTPVAPTGLPAAHSDSQLLRTGVLTALALAIHNLPEGLATFLAAMQEPSLAIPIVVAIAIHNIPEGISVSVPIYYATGNKKKAFIYSFASGLSEPLGALVGYFLFAPFLSDVVFGVIFAAVAGIMVFISLDELLPSAREYGEHHLSIYGLISGMIVMSTSLIMFI